jgi:hypothetical protein
MHAEKSPVNAVDAIMDAPKIVKFTDLSGWQHAGIAAGTAFSGAISYVTFIAIVKSFFGVNVQPGDFNKYTNTALIAGASFGAYTGYKACMPQAGWTDKDREVLTALISITDEKELLAALDLCFVNEHFGRSSAFAYLVNLSNKLTTTKEIFAKVDKKNFGPAITAIEKNINAINQALLALKNHPSWLEESKAYALTSMAHTQQAHHNAQLLGSAVFLAHQ